MEKKMETKCPYVCLYESYRRMLKPYNMEERGRIVTAMLEYMYEGVEPSFDGNERFIWEAFQGQMERDVEAYEQRCEANRRNAKKGGRPKTKPIATDGIFSEPNKPNEKENDNDNENENDNDRDKENDKGNEKENEKQPAGGGHTPFEIPDVKAIEDYCFESGLRVDARRFVDYYEARGWSLSGQRIRDWRPLVRIWAAGDWEYDNPYAGTLALVDKYLNRSNAEGT